jgi:uracil phosphoribosyltransferase
MLDPKHPTPMRGRSQPARQDVAGLPQLRLFDHPLLSHLITLLRDVRTSGPEFTRATEEITRFLLWQALEEAEVEPIEVPGHTGEPVAGARLRDEIASLAILRAGLSMVPPVRLLIPQAPVYQVGVRRDEATLIPQVYYTNLPPSWSRIQHLLILDPMLATGGSAVAAIQRVRGQFEGQISFLGMIGAPIGVQRVVEADPSIRIFLGVLDDRLNERGYIVPGLGDAGDRVFGTT